MPSFAMMSERQRNRHNIARAIVSSMYISIFIFGVGIWFSLQSSTKCDRVLQTPFIVLGVFIALVSIPILCYIRNEVVVCLYYVFMFLLILGLFILTIFTFAVTGKGGGEALPGKEYKEYRLQDYSNWLQKSVDNTKNWNNNIRSCLKDHTKVCQSLIDDGTYNTTTVDQFYNEPLSSLQSGCCKPSNDCNFIYVSPTNWTITGGSYNNSDCSLWSNDQNILCFDCQSCKAGLLDNVKHNLKKVAVIMIICLVLLSILYTGGLWSLSNDQ